MKRIFCMIGPLFAYICIGTVIAQTALVGYLWKRGHLTREKVVDVLIVAHGVEVEDTSVKNMLSESETSEQIAHDHALEARAVKSRQLELRQILLDDSIEELGRIRRLLNDERKQFSKVSRAFNAQLKEIDEGARKKASDELGVLISLAAPKQAKTQLLLMWNKDQDQPLKNREQRQKVVTLLSTIDVSKRKKIVGEFKTEEDNEVFAEILEEISQGGPEVDLVDATRNELGQVKSNFK